MDHFPIPTFPPDERVWVRVRKMCVEYKGQKEKVAWSPSPHSIFFMSFSLLHISEVCLFAFASETWTKLPEKQIHCKFFPIFLHVNHSKTVPLPASPPSLLYPIIFTFLFCLFLVRHWLLPVIADSSLFIICHLTLTLLFWLEGIFVGDLWNIFFAGEYECVQ